MNDWESAAREHVDASIASVEFELAALIKAGDANAAYNPAFIAKCSLLEENALFDVKRRLKALKEFEVREWSRRIKVERETVTRPVKVAVGWQALLKRSEQGYPKPLLVNATTALRHHPDWQGVLAYNEFSFRIEKKAPPPYTPESTGQWVDTDNIKASEWLQNQDINVGVATAADAAHAVSVESRFHPVREYLTGLKWDGEKRIHRFLCDYFGVEFSELTCLISSRWLISAVARVMDPGCQVDTCLVLEGGQGIRKSTTLRALVPIRSWFTDQIADLDNPEASKDLAGKWIIEFPELEKFSSKHDQGVIKSFIPRQTDHYRASYGRMSQDWDRQCVFCASTNKFNWAGDETGGRRWLPVRCGDKVDIEGVREIRDQVWAESHAAYNDGVRWWFDDSDPCEIREELRQEQAARYETDPWDATVVAWLEDQEKKLTGWNKPTDLFWTKSEIILDECLKKPITSWSQIDKNRVQKILVLHGFERYQRRILDSDDLPILDDKGKQKREWCYRRKLK